MGAMSDLDLLARRVVEGDESIDEVTEDTVYEKADIVFAVEELRKA